MQEENEKSRCKQRHQLKGIRNVTYLLVVLKPPTKGHQEYLSSHVKVKVRFVWLLQQGEHTLGEPKEGFRRREMRRAPYRVWGAWTRAR